MGTTVPSLEGQTYLTDPQSIIGYTLRRYQRTPKDAVTILPDMIISLTWRIAEFGKEPDALCSNIQSDLQNVFNRIFANQRKVSVNVTHTTSSANTYDVSVSVIYTTVSGELGQGGGKIKLDKETGRLVIPEDQIEWAFSPYASK